MTAKKLTEGEEAYAKSLELYQRLNQGEKCSELRAELAWLAYERGDHELAQKYIDTIFLDRSQAALTSIQQPSICRCGYEVLKDKEPETARILLEHGYSTLCKTAERITDPGARE